MLKAHTIFSDFSMCIKHNAPVLSPDVEDEVERIWVEQQKRKNKTFFNGRILSATNVTFTGLEGCIAEYRHLVAQQVNPQLYDELKVQPVALSGLLECPDGIVFGKRARNLLQESGQWELVPSGGIDTRGVEYLGHPIEVDFTHHILKELKEEVGLTSAITKIRPFCLVEDTDSHVFDIGIAIETFFPFDDLVAMHKEKATDEYDELRVIPKTEIINFIDKEDAQLVGVSKMLLLGYLNSFAKTG